MRTIEDVERLIFRFGESISEALSEIQAEVIEFIQSNTTLERLEESERL
jgi:hypothetical protein